MLVNTALGYYCTSRTDHSSTDLGVDVKNKQIGKHREQMCFLAAAVAYIPLQRFLWTVGIKAFGPYTSTLPRTLHSFRAITTTSKY